MRISTSNFYDNSTLQLNNLQSTITDLSQQISTGKKGVTPQDDPSAAVQILSLSQTTSLNVQLSKNRVALGNTLGEASQAMGGMINNLTSVNEQVLSASNGTLNAVDRANVAQNLQGYLDGLLGLANTNDGAGHYIFAGFNVATQPSNPVTNATDINTSIGVAANSPGATITSIQTAAQNAINSNSNLSASAKTDALDTLRTLVALYARSDITSASPVSSFASNLIGALSVSAGALPTLTLTGITATTQSSGVLQADAGSDPNKSITASTGGVLSFNLSTISNGTTANSLGSPTGLVTVGGTPTPYNLYSYNGTSSSAQIQVDVGRTAGLGVTVGTLFGTDANNFLNKLSKAIAVLKSPTQTTADSLTALQDLGGSYTTTLNNVLQAQSQVGITQNQMTEIDTLSTTKNNETAKVLSSLQDTDYNKALSDLAHYQLELQAAQKSFQQISNLSLFNYIN